MNLGSGLDLATGLKASNDGADSERLVLEARHARRLTRVLRSMLRELLPQDVSPDIAAHAVSRLQQYRKPLHDALYQMLLEGARLGTDHGRHAVEVLHGTAAKALASDGRLEADGTMLSAPDLCASATHSVKALDSTAISTDWDLVNEDARLWASQYAGQLVDGITATSTTLLQGALSDYIAGTITYRDLIAHLAPTFGSRRAETIATTEITAAYSNGLRVSLKRSGVVEQVVFRNVRDERVCSRCGPMDGVVMTLDGGDYPPLHTRCRCFLAPYVGD